MKYKAFVILILILLGFATPIVFVSDVHIYLASLFFVNDLTSADVRAHYQQRNVSILIVPGHDNKNYGTWYKGMKEADLVAEIGENLYEYLARDGRFNVTLVRNRNGYTQEFSDYFTKQKNNIAFFIHSVWTYFNELTRTQQIAISPQKVHHNRVNRETQIALYGINK
ncbi:N-acetylmuramoyl-L-alanine amidase, partial [Patescibacteria group bacterium]|nr:N-acetylmuramoyl-L-alanine amidase [Patescibacteria group bacterium]